MNANSFGSNLKRLREKHGYSRAELAELSGLTLFYVRDLEQNKRMPGLERVVALAVALRVSLDEFVKEVAEVKEAEKPAKKAKKK